MRKYFHSATVGIALLSAACREKVDGYLAAASVSENGFARDGGMLREANGQEVMLWGYVDSGNLYGDAGAWNILGEWWSGEGPSPTTWRFNLKAKADDEAGQSFAVLVPNDAGRDDLLTAFLADARAGRPTKVFVKGRLFVFSAPTQTGLLTGIYLALQSSRDVRLGTP